ncbi:hypothetical protein [Micromonospora sp. HM5-17]|jgi:hypothetical protein|uniref:hypothetical protein n=1 Tax=Micromonospora sp. HM5-17 TaxID=2487710 RepID=UPI001F2D171D|nr:hypothetical protein [Micromonospora sp. HM5-17]
MEIKPEMVDYLRTMIKGDLDANSRIEAQLDEKGWDDFPKLLGAVFFLAVDRQFGDDASAAEIVQFVAEMRAKAPVDPAVIDANAAETLIKSALDPALDHDVESEMIGRIQTLTIMHVLGAEDVSDDDLDDVLEEAVQLVGRL